MIQEHDSEIHGRILSFQLRRSERRTLAITVRPDLSVVVTAPRKAALADIVAKVRKRATWIRRQQRYFGQFLPQTPPRQYVNGETHRYLGRQYRLKVVLGKPPEVKLRGGFLWVHTPRTDRNAVQRLVRHWYLERAKERLEKSYTMAVARLGARLDASPVMRVRRMRKRWGSWSSRLGIWLNPELVKVPVTCIDYVVTHELCHAVHGDHGKKFYELLRRLMPDWEQRKARLERIGSD